MAKTTLSFKELQDESKVDTQIDKNKLDKYSLELPQLSAKWQRYLLEEKIVYESESIRYAVLKKKKHEYYLTDYKLIIEKRGGEIDIYINSDQDLLQIKDKLIISKEKMLFIEGIIKILNAASFNVKNAIEWNKFTSGY